MAYFFLNQKDKLDQNEDPILRYTQFYIYLLNFDNN